MTKLITMKDDIRKFNRDEIAYTLLVYSKTRNLINYTRCRMRLTNKTLQTKMPHCEFESMVNTSIVTTLRQYDCYLAHTHNDVEAIIRLNELKKSQDFNYETHNKMNFPHIDALYGYMTKVMHSEGLMYLEHITAVKRERCDVSIYAKGKHDSIVNILEYIEVPKVKSLDEVGEEICSYIKKESKKSYHQNKSIPKFNVSDIFKDIYINNMNRCEVYKKYKVGQLDIVRIRTFIDKCLENFGKDYKDENELMLKDVA